MFSAEGIEGVKQGCEGEVFSELLSAGLEWRSASPPMTPGMYFLLNLVLSYASDVAALASHRQIIT
jgi:hypothetical protein